MKSIFYKDETQPMVDVERFTYKDTLQPRIKQQLERAVILGTVFGDKSEIYFEDYDGQPRKRTAVVQALTTKNVVLKGGERVPLDCILKIVV